MRQIIHIQTATQFKTHTNGMRFKFYDFLLLFADLLLCCIFRFSLHFLRFSFLLFAAFYIPPHCRCCFLLPFCDFPFCSRLPNIKRFIKNKTYHPILVICLFFRTQNFIPKCAEGSIQSPLLKQIIMNFSKYYNKFTDNAAPRRCAKRLSNSIKIQTDCQST